MIKRLLVISFEIDVDVIPVAACDNRFPLVCLVGTKPGKDIHLKNAQSKFTDSNYESSDFEKCLLIAIRVLTDW